MTQHARCNIPRLRPGTTLATGSMPHRDPERAIDLLLKACPEAPCWPQLPALGFQETMVAQFSEGIPCLRVDREVRKVLCSLPESDTDALAGFYQGILDYEEAGTLDPFEISPAFAEGLHAFIGRLDRGRDEPLAFVKGQTTGPLTFGLSIIAENGLPALFDDTLSDVVLKAVRMKALWQVDRLRPLARNGILFVDEPMLAGFGSAAFISLSREKAVSALREVFSAVKEAGFLVGSHCCANTDWSLMVEAGVDIINFDAYAYTDSLGLYAASLSDFLVKGGYLAWGIVPSDLVGARPSTEDLFDRLVRGIASLKEKGLPSRELEQNLLLTTSCGLGLLKEAEAEAVLEELARLCVLVRRSI